MLKHKIGSSEHLKVQFLLLLLLLLFFSCFVANKNFLLTLLVTKHENDTFFPTKKKKNKYTNSPNKNRLQMIMHRWVNGQKKKCKNA